MAGPDSRYSEPPPPPTHASMAYLCPALHNLARTLKAQWLYSKAFAVRPSAGCCKLLLRWPPGHAGPMPPCHMHEMSLAEHSQPAGVVQPCRTTGTQAMFGSQQELLFQLGRAASHELITPGSGGKLPAHG